MNEFRADTDYGGDPRIHGSGSPEPLGRMTSHLHHITAAADRVPFGQKMIYGTGQISNVILAIAIANLAPLVLTVELGVSALLVGLAMGLPRVWDAFTDPVIGYLSDNARTRWGRRKPFMFVGLLCVAACLALHVADAARMERHGVFLVFFFGMSLVFYLAYTVYATPFVALGYELTPDYHERTRVMGVMNFMGNLAAVPMAWMFAVMQWDAFDDGVQGARVLAVVLAVLVVIFGLVPIIFLRDPSRDRFAVRQADPLPGGAPKLGFFSGLKTTLRNRSFLYLCLATLLFFPGLILIQNFGSFLLIYYVYGGAKDAASVAIGWSGTLSAVLTLADSRGDVVGHAPRQTSRVHALCRVGVVWNAAQMVLLPADDALYQPAPRAVCQHRIRRALGVDRIHDG